MPSIELLGYEQDVRINLENDLRTALDDLPFKHEIVFVAFHTEVTDFYGNKQSYLRVSTRNEEKAAMLMDRLKLFADVEYIASKAILFKEP